MKHPTLFRAIVGGFALLVGSVSAVAQASSYQQTNLVSDLAGAAVHTDPKLINPWGIAFVPGQPFVVADNNSGSSTSYDANGVSQGDFLIPAPPNDNSRMPRLRGRPLPRRGRSPSAVLTASFFSQRKMGPSRAGMARAMQSSRSTTLALALYTKDWQC